MLVAVGTRQRGGVAIASLALVDYTDNDLGSYKELALAVLVDDPDGPTGRGAPVSTLIHRLPVSETFTCLAGYGIWGFPKWVADLTVDFDDRGAVGVLRSDDGQEVVRVTMRRGPIPLPAKPMPMQAFTCADDGAVRATPWETRTSGRQHVRPGGTSVEIGYGHPIADELRALGLPKRALMTLFDDHMSATFGAPRIVAGVGRTLAT